MSTGSTTPMGFCSKDGPSITLRLVRLSAPEAMAPNEFAVFRPPRRFRDLPLSPGSFFTAPAIPGQVALPQCLLAFRRISSMR